MSAPIAIGVGCRRDCPADAIEALVRQALARAPAAKPMGLFTIQDKSAEPGLLEAATRLGLALVFLPPDALRAQDAHIQTRSPAAQRRFGVASVAEAAALAGAGANATLVGPRLAAAGATCALARAAS